MTVRKTVKRKAGRPSLEFNQKTANRICEQIIEGKSLRRICKAKNMPSLSTVMKWLRETPQFAQHYARAREEQSEGYANDLIDLAKQANASNAHAIRVKADIIKWVCSKLKSKMYGDKAAIELSARPQPAWDEMNDDQQIEIARRVYLTMELAARAIEKRNKQAVVPLLLPPKDITPVKGGD